MAITPEVQSFDEAVLEMEEPKIAKYGDHQCKAQKRKAQIDQPLKCLHFT